MIRIIINADDLGKDAVVNAAIADALEMRCITSSTIMANSSTWEQVHQIVEANPQASFGVHLNLTEGKALTNSPVFKEYGIVDSDNCFTKQIQKQKSFPKNLRDAVLNEWIAQVEKVKHIERIPVSHLDGHHHVHTILGLERELIALLKKYSIQCVRRDYYLPSSFVSKIHSFVGHILRGQFGRMLWHKKISHSAKTTDYFCSYETACVQIEKGMVFPSDCSMELMCHPGHNFYSHEEKQVRSDLIRSVGVQLQLENYNTL